MLQAVKAHLKSIAADPEDYVDAWGLEDEEEVTAAMMGRLAVELSRCVDIILAMPIQKRGERGCDRDKTVPHIYERAEGVDRIIAILDRNHGAMPKPN